METAFRHYRDEDYEAVCDFLIALNRTDRDHINWNWARFEWMMGHPEFDRSTSASIGLWTHADRVIGAAIYDMYFGEAFCGVLPEFVSLYPEILDYAYRELKDGDGLAIAICDGCSEEIEAAEKAGFQATEQTETIMKLDTDRRAAARLPEDLQLAQLDPGEEPEAFLWLLWQGFDHGSDRAAFEKEGTTVTKERRHFDPRFSLTAVDRAGEKVGYCCLWYQKGTDYAYVEPVCTVPAYRGKGVAKALISEAAARTAALGAKAAYVISDMPFYEKLGFTRDRHYTFYRKP